MLVSCGDDGPANVDRDGGDAMMTIDFYCANINSTACVGQVWHYCEQNGEFLTERTDDCAARDPAEICWPELGCVRCRPGELGCFENNVIQCSEDGRTRTIVEECSLPEGYICRDAMCQNLCDVAIADRSYVGCEFYGADLDNAAIGAGRDASAQQYAIVVSNPGSFPTTVVVEQNDAQPGEPVSSSEVMQVDLLPGDLEVLALPRREVDGSSSNAVCDRATRECGGNEVCVCPMNPTAACLCRVSEDADGLNDGTHSALTSHAYRVRSSFPIIAYQFNPLDNVQVFSNDASLLLPTSAIGSEYTVVGWPQTIADGPDSDPTRDFDPTRDDEGLRAFLTIVGTAEATNVTVTLGDRAHTVVGGGPIPTMGAGMTYTQELGPFDVLNLETAGLNSDFTGSRVVATQPVSVFSGSEASDAPRFETYLTRQCCADHLEEQLFSDSTLGSSFIIARTPPRTVALNDAFLDPTTNSVAEVNEPEWVRVVAVGEGTTEVRTTLPPPDDRFTLAQGQSTILRADQDFEMDALDRQPLAVLQVLSSQAAVGIPSDYPGGAPAIVAIPPIQQYRQDYVFLTPDKYAFDFVVITADHDTYVELDGAPLDPRYCTTSPADGIERKPMDPPPDRVIHRCQLSFPDVVGRPNVRVEPGIQNDGVHTVVADAPVGILVYGFDAYVSYAYAAGLNLMEIPR